MASLMVFVGEADAVAMTQFDASMTADHEAQRELAELLAQMNGFDGFAAEDVRVIMPTDRAAALDRKVEFALRVEVTRDGREDSSSGHRPSKACPFSVNWLND